MPPMSPTSSCETNREQGRPSHTQYVASTGQGMLELEQWDIPLGCSGDSTSGMCETDLYERLPGRNARCNICQRGCLVAEGGTGYCMTRQNQKGKLYSLIYGEVSCLAVSPTEKKPVFHFYPASRWLSLGSLGCNFRCPGCQNWRIAHSTLLEEQSPSTKYLSPEDCVALARQHKCLGISWTYNEPTLWFEYTLKAAKLAKYNGLFTNYVTNGFMTQAALDRIGPYLDVFRVDIKGFSSATYKKIANVDDFYGILAVTERAKSRWGMHVEVVTNVIPGYNDDDTQLSGIASWVRQNLGEDTPWHVTQFVPHLELSHIMPTPIATLERARQIGFENGLHYAYVGNIPGHPGQNTYCPKCHSLLVKRDGFSVAENRIVAGKCPQCSGSIAGRFG